MIKFVTNCIRIIISCVFFIMETNTVNSAGDNSKCSRPKNYEIVKDITITPFFYFSDRKLHSFTYSLNEIYSFLSQRKLNNSGNGNLMYLSGVGIIKNNRVTEKASKILMEHGLTRDVSGMKLGTNKCSLQVFFKEDGSHAYSIVFNDKKTIKTTDLDYKCMILSTASMYGCKYRKQIENVEDMLTQILSSINYNSTDK